MTPDSALAQISSDAEADALRALLLVLYPEVGRVCLLEALNCCISNALAAGRSPVNWRMLMKYYPRASAPLLITSLRLNRFWPEKAITRSLAQFHDLLAASSASSVAFAGSSCKSDRALVSRLARDHIACCAAGRELLVAIEKELSLWTLASSLSPDVQLRRLMDQVIQGASPGLLSDGTVDYPAWAERRRHQRIEVSCPAELSAGRTSRVVIKDISLAGVGLQINDGCELKVGEQVTLHVGGERIYGTVMWMHSGMAAVAFQQPLTRNDPRLSFCLATQDTDAPSASNGPNLALNGKRADLFDVAD